MIIGGNVSKPHLLSCSDAYKLMATKDGDEVTGNAACAKAVKNKALVLGKMVIPETTHGEGTNCTGESSDSVIECDTTCKSGLRPLHGDICSV